MLSDWLQTLPAVLKSPPAYKRNVKSLDVKRYDREIEVPSVTDSVTAALTTAKRGLSQLVVWPVVASIHCSEDTSDIRSI